MNVIQSVIARLTHEPAVVFGALASLLTALAEAVADGPLTLAAVAPVLLSFGVRHFVTPEDKAKAREHLAFVDGILAAENDSDDLVLDVAAIDPDDNVSFLRLLNETPDQDDEGSTGVQV